MCQFLKEIHLPSLHHVHNIPPQIPIALQIYRIQKGREDETEEISSYWIVLRKREDTGI
jgi:hypothetical protein